MNEEELKEFMKKRYLKLAYFDNLLFVKDCKEEGIKEHKKKVEGAIIRMEIIRDNCTDERQKEIYGLAIKDFKEELGLK